MCKIISLNTRSQYLPQCSSRTGRGRLRTAAAPHHRPHLLHCPAKKERCGAGLEAGRGSSPVPHVPAAACFTPGAALHCHSLPGPRGNSQEPTRSSSFTSATARPAASALLCAWGWVGSQTPPQKAAAQSRLASGRKRSRSGCSQPHQQHHTAPPD